MTGRREIKGLDRVEYRVPGLDHTGVFGTVIRAHFTAMLFFRNVPPMSYDIEWEDGTVTEKVLPGQLSLVGEDSIDVWRA